MCVYLTAYTVPITIFVTDYAYIRTEQLVIRCVCSDRQRDLPIQYLFAVVLSLSLCVPYFSA